MTEVTTQQAGSGTPSGTTAVKVPANVASTASLPAAGVPATWVIDANRLRSVDQQETNLTGGDEVYVASIAFRTTPGKANSTSAKFHGNLVDINNVHQGETHAIPDGMGRVPFTSVVRRSLADVLAGKTPELIGTATLVFESDLTPDGVMDNVLTQAAAKAKQVIASAIEPLSLADLADEDEVGEVLGDAADGLEGVKPTVLQKIGILLASLFDPDDQIDLKINVFVAVDESLADVVDDQLGAAIPASLGVGGVLRPRSYSQRFTGGGASYDVFFQVGL
jgi:hypothetical protein